MTGCDTRTNKRAAGLRYLYNTDMKIYKVEKVLNKKKWK